MEYRFVTCEHCGTGVLPDQPTPILSVADLFAAIQRIDAINDNPAHYNPEINAVCDAILRPHLAGTR